MRVRSGGDVRKVIMVDVVHLFIGGKGFLKLQWWQLSSEDMDLVSQTLYFSFVGSSHVLKMVSNYTTIGGAVCSLSNFSPTTAIMLFLDGFGTNLNLGGECIIRLLLTSR